MPLNRRLLIGGTSAAAVATTAAAFAAPTTSHAAVTGSGTVVKTGADVQAAQGWAALTGRKLGILSNPTGILADGTHIVDNMAAANLDILGVFGPEHGFRGTAQAGGSEGTSIDPRTGLTVYDLYGASVSRMTTIFQTSGIDTMVFDIQDVGSRFYTYIWTMYNAMRACVRAGVRFMVLDRPNPVGGVAKGPLMTQPFTSFVGLEAIVQQHGMTAGELAQLFNGEFLPEDEGGAKLSELTIIAAKGWAPRDLFAETNLKFVPPSPNMPTPDTSLLYPGTCMFEGTTLSEGRGTTRPFELVGAPYVDYRWAERLNTRNIPGVLFREAYFTPTFSKHTGAICGGVQVHITDPHALDAIRVGVEMLVALKSLYPTDFAWRSDNWIDKLTGSSRLRTQINAGASADEVVGAWQAELAAFDAMRQQYLIYPGKRG
ncbi:exo-beta-N-acetylmuramidase NamZ family protein [Propionibacteriaceae bacterium G1746]|uniref:exo-beta-N-acetylmuramidase NamZ family protein n=1 Tax=Aestuariimicrobium sp. G57 TaxID=3418485 RepID=UPI003C1A8E61